MNWMHFIPVISLLKTDIVSEISVAKKILIC